MERAAPDLGHIELESVSHFPGAIGKEDLFFQIADARKPPPPAKYVLFDQCGSQKVAAVHSDGVSVCPYKVPDALVYDHNMTGSQALGTLLSSADEVENLQVFKNAMAAALLEFESSHSQSRGGKLELFDSIEERQQQAFEASSSSWHENTEDLDALMESDGEESELNSESVTSGLTQDPGVNSCEQPSGYLSSEGETDGKGRSSRRFRDCRFHAPSRGGKRSRKQTIKYKIQVLRSIIPGAKGMEATSVLEETIRYITSLQALVRSTGSSKGFASSQSHEKRKQPKPC